MNTAISNIGIEHYGIPAKAASPSMKPIPEIDDLDDDTYLFRVLDPMDYSPLPAHLPEKRHQILDVDRMVVPASLIRRIGNELKHDECDARTVFDFCRGLARGTLEFENAYITARIRSFAKHQRISNDPLQCTPSDAESLQHPRQLTMKHHTLAPPHPMAVNHPGHLMSHLGIWVVALLGTQIWASWRISAFAETYLEGGQTFYFGIALFLVLALDSAVWFRRRGNLCDAFFVPGGVLFLMALLPILILHVRGVLLAMN